MANEPLIKANEPSRTHPNTLYKNADMDKLSTIVGNSSEILDFAINNKINIQDLDQVIERTQLYFKYCQDKEFNPNMRGLANFFGYSYKQLYNVINKGTKISDYLDLIRDRMKDNLEQASLCNAVNNISAMFLLKATHDYTEASKVILEPSESLLGKPKSVDEIEAFIDDDIVEI